MCVFCLHILFQLHKIPGTSHQLFSGCKWIWIVRGDCKVDGKDARKKAVARLVMKVKDQEKTTTIVVAHLQIDFSEINGFLCFLRMQ